MPPSTASTGPPGFTSTTPPKSPTAWAAEQQPIGCHSEPRVAFLDRQDMQAVGFGVEPLLGAADRLLDTLPTGDDPAELQSLIQSTQAEMRDPATRHRRFGAAGWPMRCGRCPARRRTSSG